MIIKYTLQLLNWRNILIKKLIFVLSILILVSISCVSAEDMNETSNATDSIVVSSFDDLAIKVNDTLENQTLTLDCDYEYQNGSIKGVVISKPITIDGAGHTLDGKKVSRMFNITANNVILKNIKFINGNALGSYEKIYGGGAIYWSGANGLVENCSFTNNTGSGIENDPFDKEEVTITEDGMVIHTIRIRPMGCKINEGGAIVWTGENGTVSNCNFTHNGVGYPNSGGAICWRGNDGKVLNSKFFDNYAWCGAAICWVGDNGKILFSKFLNDGISDQGLFWFGKNGLISNSILLESVSRGVIHYSGATFDANNNFWGDTIDNPNNFIKVDNVTKWFVANITGGHDFTKDFDNLQINNDSFYLFKKSILPVDKSKIKSNDLTKYYKNSKQFKVRVYGENGKLAIGKYVKFTIGKHTDKIKVDKRGYASLKINKKPGTYTVKISYGKINVKNKITIKSTLKTKNVNKKFKKLGKFTVKVLNSKGKPYSKQVVKIKFKGETYKLKTNKNGIATLKLSKKLKLGKHTIKTTCNGLTNSNKIIVKK